MAIGVAGSIVLVKELPLKKETRKKGKAINAIVFIDCRRYPAPLSADHSPIFFNWSCAHPLQHGDSHQRSSRFRHIMYRWVTYFFRHAPHQTTTYRIILKKKKLISHNQNLVLFYRVFTIFITKVIQCPMRLWPFFVWWMCPLSSSKTRRPIHILIRRRPPREKLKFRPVGFSFSEASFFFFFFFLFSDDNFDHRSVLIPRQTKTKAT